MHAVHAASKRTPPADQALVASRPSTLLGLVALFVIIILVAAPEAQQAAFVAAPPAAAPKATAIDLLVGRSTLLNIDRPIERVSLTTPDIADAMVTAPEQLLIHGKAPGTISLFVWDRSGGIRTYEVVVRRDLSDLAQQIQQLFPGEPISVAGSGRDVVLSGIVSSKYVVEKAADVAGGYVEKKENVVNLLKQQEGVASNQVMLRVRFAEVSRSALTELGASFFTGSGGFHDYVSQVTTQQFAAPDFTEMNRGSLQGADHWGGGRDTVTSTGGKQTFSDFLNLFLFNNKYNIGTVIKALQDKGLFQSLAEPNLIATNGKEASFLAGGEYPYPVIQPGSGTNSITIQFKEFGIRLSFTPTVLGGDLVNLKVRPEVSALDFTNAITLEGFRVPALSTRRTETEVELRDGQTFAIAGLLNNTVTNTMRKIPGIGDIPILGWLFKSKAMQKNQTELVVMITPQILRRGSVGVSEGLPAPVEPYLGKPERSLPVPPPYTGSPRYPAGGQGGGGETAPAPAANPAAPQNPPAAAPRPAGEAAPVATPAPLASGAERAAEVGAPMSVVAPMSPADDPSSARAEAPVVTPRAAPVTAAVADPAPAPTLTKAEMKRVERARREEAKRRAEEEKRAAEQARTQKVRDEKLAREQATRDAEAARQAAKAAEKQKAQQEKLAREQATRDAEAARQAAKAAEKQKAQQERLDREQATRDAEAAKRASTLDGKQREKAEKQNKALAEAVARLRAAQAAYQTELKRAAKPGGGDEDRDAPQKPGGEQSNDQTQKGVEETATAAAA